MNLVGKLLQEIQDAHYLGPAQVAEMVALLYDRSGLHRKTEPAGLWPGAPDLEHKSLQELQEELTRVITHIFTDDQEREPIHDHYMRGMQSYLETHYAEDIRLSDVAHSLDLSPAYLSRLVRQQTGKTFTEMLSETRVNRAIELLKGTNARVYQIADLVGLHNYAYFYQVFRKITKRSPNDFR